MPTLKRSFVVNLQVLYFSNNLFLIVPCPIQVTIRDSGGLSASTVVTITVVDVDEPPFFLESAPILRTVKEWPGIAAFAPLQRYVDGVSTTVAIETRDPEVGSRLPRPSLYLSQSLFHSLTLSLSHSLTLSLSLSRSLASFVYRSRSLSVLFSFALYGCSCILFYWFTSHAKSP